MRGFKRKSLVLSAVMSASMIVTTVVPSSVEASANSGEAQPQGKKIQLQHQKPKVADVPTNNHPNRIITNINGKTKSEMGFSWYTTNQFKDAKVWVSQSKDFKHAKSFKAKSKKVNSKYLERDKAGNIIFKDIEKDDEGKPVKKNGKPKVNGYYTDKNVGGPAWTSGDQHGETDLINTPEYTYKAKAKNLKPNTQYYYKVGSEKAVSYTHLTLPTSGLV